MTRIDNGDGTWSTPRVSTTDEEIAGPFVWRYAGQARIPDHPECVDSLSFVHDDAPPATLADQLRGMHRITRAGEVWVVADVDENQLDPELVDGVDAQIAEWVAPAPEDRGVVEEWVPYAWSGEDCDGLSQNGNEVKVWDGESRVRKTEGFTARQKATVRTNFNGAECTGTRLNAEWVVTSAHCLEDHDGQLFGELYQLIVFDVLVNTAEVEDVFIAGHHSGNDPYNWNYLDHDYADDWALIQMAESFPTVAEDMDLYGGEDSTFEDIGANVHNNGFPRHVLDESDDCVEGDDDLFVLSNALVTSTANQRTKWKTDSSPGMSGSSYYFCPDGADDVCADGDVGMIVALASGFNTVEDRHIGPKASAFRAAALTCMNNH